MPQGACYRHDGNGGVLLLRHLYAPPYCVVGDKRTHSVVEAYKSFSVVGNECQSVLRRLEPCFATVGNLMWYGEMILLAQLVPVFLLLLRQDDNKMHLGIVLVEPLQGPHEYRLTVDFEELLRNVASHPCAVAAGNDYHVGHKLLSFLH